MIEIINNIINRFHFSIGLVLLIISIINCLWGVYLFKHVLSWLGFLVGFGFGSLCGITLSSNFWIIIIFAVIGALLFSMTLYIYRSIGLFLLSALISWFILYSWLNLPWWAGIVISLVIGIISMLFRVISLTVCISILSGTGCLFSLRLLFYPTRVNIWIILASLFLALLCLGWQLFFILKIHTKAKPLPQKTSPPPDPSTPPPESP
ncbi:MAG: hypothetical protein ACP5FK_04665 [bacterium]